MTQMVSIPTGRLKRLVWRSAGPNLQQDMLAVYFEGPDGEEYEQGLANPHYSLDNPALQFLAAKGYKPSDIEGTSYDAWDDQKGLLVAPLDPGDPESGWAISEQVLEAGRDDLEDADWFDGAEEPTEIEVEPAPQHDAGGSNPRA